MLLRFSLIQLPVVGNATRPYKVRAKTNRREPTWDQQVSLAARMREPREHLPYLLCPFRKHVFFLSGICMREYFWEEVSKRAVKVRSPFPRGVRGWPIFVTFQFPRYTTRHGSTTARSSWTRSERTRSDPRTIRFSPPLFFPPARASVVIDLCGSIHGHDIPRGSSHPQPSATQRKGNTHTLYLFSCSTQARI